jgi:hypothetical protein
MAKFRDATSSTRLNYLVRVPQAPTSPIAHHAIVALVVTCGITAVDLLIAAVVSYTEQARRFSSAISSSFSAQCTDS